MRNGPGRLPGDAAVENQLHLIGTAEVEILADDLFEEAAAGARPIEDLGQGEFGLEDRQLIAIARGAVGGGEGMRQAAEPLAEDRVDLRGIERVGDTLHACRRVAGPDAVVERLVGDAALRELTFEPLVPIQTDLHGIGEVGAELDEQRAEVAVEEVDVVVIDHRRRADDPRVRRPVAAFRRFSVRKTLAFSWALPTNSTPSSPVERGEVLLRDVILPLPLLERHQIEALRLDEALDGLHEPLAHRRHHHGRRHAGAEMLLHEVHDPAARLQRRDVAVEIHPVDRFQFEGHVVVEDFRDAFAYHGAGAPGERGPRGHRPQEGLLPRRRVQSLPAPGAPLFLTRPCLRPARASGQLTTCSTV